jgi:hypothetical protein
MTVDNARLTASLVAIGMNFAADPASDEPDIEETLVAASVVAMDGAVRTVPPASQAGP